MKILLQIFVFVLIQGIAVTAKIQKRAGCTVPYSMLGKCQCPSNVIICSDISTILPQDRPTTAIRLEVTDSVLTLNATSFKNWNLTELVLKNCFLIDSSFSIDTFNGLENDLRILSLANNNITRLPSALSKFKKLENLNMTGNPIDEHGFDENVLRDLGDTLLTFSFGNKIGGTSLKKWPVTIKHLPKLQELTLSAADIKLLPSDAFHGFEGTILRLTIAHTLLTSVPLAISRLRYLQELHFDHNTNVGDQGMKIPLIRGFLPYLNQMSLKDDNITLFPQVLESFERLDLLNMDENNLKFVSDKSAEAVTQISSLSLQNSGITRVPGAIQAIKYLNVLDLSNNSIHAIETHDFQNSTELLTIKLNNNPILYISDKAFARQIKLRRLELKNIQMTRVPCAIEPLIRNHRVGFVVINLSENDIECNCGLKWLYDVRNAMTTQNRRFKIEGHCGTINSSLEDYINKYLHECPTTVQCSDAI